MLWSVAALREKLCGRFGTRAPGLDVDNVAKGVHKC